MRAFEIFGQKFFRRITPPCIGAFFFHNVLHFSDSFRGNHIFSAIITVESGNRHAPGTLAGNTPILTVTDHIVKTVMAPRGNERCIVHCFQCFFTEIIDRSKPLLCRSVNDGVLTTPAVSILVMNGFLSEKHTCMSQFGNTGSFRFPSRFSFDKFARFFCHAALIIDRTNDLLLQLACIFIFLVNFKVIDTVAGSGMNAACTCIERDVASFKHVYRAVIEFPRMSECRHIPFFARHFTAGKFVIFNLAIRHSRRSKFLIHEIIFVGIEIMHPYISKFRIDGNIQVRRNGPRRSRPDDRKKFRQIDPFRPEIFNIQSREFYINGRRFSVLIFDFRFCQRRFTVRAPVNRFLALVNIAFIGHFTENFNLPCFQMGIESDITVFKIADNTHADKIGFLDFNPFLCIRKALAAEFQRRHIGPVLSRIFQHRILNRQPVGIPAGHIIDLISCHMAVTDDNILQRLIQSVTDMNLPVCIRRPVMKNELFRSFIFSLCNSFFIQIAVLP